MRSRLPARGPEIASRVFLRSFDVDCGELLPGHRFIARGLAGTYPLPIPEEWEGDDAQYAEMLGYIDAGGYPGFSLEYELTPGIPAGAEEDGFFRYLVRIEYEADVQLPWYPQDGGAIAAFAGGETTHGSRGDWPLPPAAQVLTFTMYRVNDAGFTEEAPAGRLIVDLPGNSARWQP